MTISLDNKSKITLKDGIHIHFYEFLLNGLVNNFFDILFIILNIKLIYLIH